MSLALISPPLVSQPSEAAPEEVLRCPPREGLGCFLVKMGHTGPLVEPRCRPHAGKSRDPYSQNAHSSPQAQGTLGLGFEVKPKGKRGAPQAQQPASLGAAWQLIGRGRLRFPTSPQYLPG